MTGIHGEATFWRAAFREYGKTAGLDPGALRTLEDMDDEHVIQAGQEVAEAMLAPLAAVAGRLVHVAVTAYRESAG
jgi:hypothetical protein